MRFVWNFVWAALEVVFLFLFFRIYLQRKGNREETLGFLISAWIFSGVYGCFFAEGIFGYLMTLLVAALMLLCLFGESGGRGLSLLAFGVLIPVCCRQLSWGWAILAVCLLALWRFGGARQTHARGETDDLLLRQNMEMQRESMQALEQNYRIQRKSAHEFEHHMQVLRDLLDQDQTDAARDYLARLKKSRSIHVMRVNSHHPVIDVILNQKYQSAQENDIRMQIRVNDLSAVQIPTDSMAVMLTNLLDNAIEACRRVDGCREIVCSVLYEDGLYISIRNSSPPVRIEGGRLQTSKADTLSHGFGMLSVTHVLDELGAEYTFGYDEGWFHFAAEIE